MKPLTLRPSAGFSLIEVLVSIVILSIALLGTAGLTAASLKSTSNAFYRSQATVLADDLLDRMRANLEEARDDGYNVDLGPDCANATPSLSLFDCQEWTAMVAQTLPGGDATVVVDDDGVATITITWDGGANSFTTETRL